MILKKLQTGATTVIVTKKEYNEYISQGYTYIEDVEVAMNIDEAEEENIRFKLDGTSLYWKYESDFNWTLFAGGGGGTSTSKVKVNASDSTEQYLSDKLVADTGTEISVVDTAGVKTLKFKSKANIPAYNVTNAYKLGDTVEYTDSKEYRANADISANTAWAIGTTGATWKLVGGSSGGSGVTVYADLAAIKAVDTTAYTTVQTVQVTSLGLYKFQPSSTLTGDDVNVITPTVGSSAGRWVKQSLDSKEVVNTTGQSWSTTENMPVINGKKPLLVNPSLTGKTVVGLGSSVLQGYTLANPATENYFYLFGQEIGTDYTFINLGIPSDTSQLSYERIYKEVISKDPQIVWIGTSPNNNGIAGALSTSQVFSAISAFEKYLNYIINILDKHNIKYIVGGLYPKNTCTAFAYPHIKKYNNILAKRFGARYINWYSALEDGTGKWRTGLYSADGTHPNATGQLRMKTLIPKNILNYISSLEKKYEKGKNGIKIGASDTSTVRPISLISAESEIREEIISIAIDFTGTVAQNEVLLSLSSSLTVTVDLTVDGSGNVVLNKNGTTAFLATTTKLLNGVKNTIGLDYNQYDNIFHVWLNGVLIGTSTAYSGFFSNNISIGGTSFSATQNTKNVTYYNIRKYNCILTDIDWKEDYKGILISSNLGIFSQLNNIKEEATNFLSNEGIYPTYGIMVNSTTFTNDVSDGDNIFTNTEKTKIANSLNGTFTTVDGKTITITGGMVTSIV